MKRILAMILVAVLLFTAALPGLAATGSHQAQTQMQTAALLPETGSSARALVSRHIQVV